MKKRLRWSDDLQMWIDPTYWEKSTEEENRRIKRFLKFYIPLVCVSIIFYLTR